MRQTLRLCVYASEIGEGEGDHKTLAQSLAHGEQSQEWMVSTQIRNECLAYSGDGANTKAPASALKGLLCVENVQTDLFWALAFPN